MQRVGERQVVFDDPALPVSTAIYRTTLARPGERVQGPCIIEYPGQSVVVPPGASACADAQGHLEVTLPTHVAAPAQANAVSQHTALVV